MNEIGSEALDVVIVGAGIAGLTAAHRMHKAGLDVRVLEAGSDVGGRARSITVDGEAVDLGGQFIGREHALARQLVREMQLTLRPARLTLGPTYWLDDDGGRSSTLLRLGPGDVIELWKTLRSAARFARTVPARSPWEGDKAYDLDNLSTQQWLDTVATGIRARALLDQIVTATFCTPPSDLSLLHLLWGLTRAGGLRGALIGTWHSTIDEGAQALPRALAGRLYPRIVLNQRAVRIEQSADHVTVVSASGTATLARRAIVAVPISVLSAIDFDPPLPDELRDLSRLSFGQAVKVAGVLREQRVCAPRVLLGRSGLWLAWRVRRVVAALAAPGTEPNAVGEDLQRVFGPFVAPLQVFDWSADERTKGTYVAFGPGQVCTVGPRLTQPQGLVEFAGAERSSWPNSMEGAIESGLRAANNILAARERAT